MLGQRRPWLTTSLALVLGPVAFGLMLMSEAAEDYSGWALVTAACQLLWLWTVDLRGDSERNQTRMPLAGRITATILVGCAGGLVCAGPIFSIFEMAVNARLTSHWDSFLGLSVLSALPSFTLAWGVGAWMVTRQQAPRVAVRSLLAPLTILGLLSSGLGVVSGLMARDSDLFLAGLMPLVALVGALVVLAWSTLPWLELLLSRRGRDRGPASGPTPPAARF